MDWARIQRAERELRGSVFRVGWPRTDKDRTAAMISSLFLHVHPAKVRPESLRFSYSLGRVSSASSCSWS
jgi:hypothetical protein